jgi:pyrimidine-nucleoside phosphorylase
MLYLGGATKTEALGYELAEKMLISGKAMEKFEELCKLHGGDLSKLPKPKVKLDIFSPRAGFVSRMDCEKIGIVGIKIKAGRSKTTDIIEPTAGIEFHKKVGDQIALGEPLFTLHGTDMSVLRGAQAELLSTTQISESQCPLPQLILKTLF